MSNVPAQYVDRVEPSAPQRGFLASLVDERDLSTLTDVQRRWLKDEVGKGNDSFIGVNRAKASEIIALLLALPKGSKAQLNGQDMPAIPAGRYAIENEEGELRFYRLWVGRTGYMKMYVQHGPDDSALHFNTMRAILQKIEKAGVHECATRYGREIGACCICGRRLTNTLSRYLGIGPVCGGRTWRGDDSWKEHVHDARQELVNQGIDPDSETHDA